MATLYCLVCEEEVEANDLVGVVRHADTKGKRLYCAGSFMPGAQTKDEISPLRQIHMYGVTEEKPKVDDRVPVTLRLPSDIHSIVRGIAVVDGRSANDIIEEAVRDYIDKKAQDKDFQEEVLETFGTIIQRLTKVRI